jgi:hypothetical protein
VVETRHFTPTWLMYPLDNNLHYAGSAGNSASRWCRSSGWIRVILQVRSQPCSTEWGRFTGAETRVSTRWPPYALPPGSPLRDALLKAATWAGLAPTAKIAGPSNIRNYLVGLGIPATAGFGVDYRGLHGTDERIRLHSVPIVQAVYHGAAQPAARCLTYADTRLTAVQAGCPGPAAAMLR